jgi:glycosyltransferase involved in cell wall biosynthesis
MARQGSLSAELSKCENIELLEQINHSELMDLMAGAKAVILPSQVYEGFLMIVPEAFSICAPMIVGNIGNSSVLIKDGYNGMKFKYDSAKSMIDAIDRFEEAD